MTQKKVLAASPSNLMELSINTKYLTADQIRSLYFDLDSELAAVPSPQETQNFGASDWQ